MKRDPIDFHLVEDQHLAIHARLENWARWSRNRGRGETAPGFALYRASNLEAARRQYSAPVAPAPVNPLDAAKIAKGVGKLPDPHRDAIVWCYLERDAPAAARRRLATTYEGLLQLVRDGRQMLINRGV